MIGGGKEIKQAGAELCQFQAQMLASIYFVLYYKEDFILFGALLDKTANCYKG